MIIGRQGLRDEVTEEIHSWAELRFLQDIPLCFNILEAAGKLFWAVAETKALGHFPAPVHTSKDPTSL